MRGLKFRSLARIKPFLIALILLILAGSAAFVSKTQYYAEKKEALYFLTQQAALAADLRLNEIFVRGRNKTPQKDILEILKAERGMPLTAINLPQARFEIQRLPWVKTVEIERRLPHFLLVNLTERKPVAVWQHHGKYRPVDEQGQVIETYVKKLNGLPLVLGSDAPEKTPELLSFLAQEEAIFKRVKAAVRVGKRRWNILLDDLNDGITIRLPESDPANEWGRLARLNKAQGLLEREISMIDLRQPDKLIVHVKKNIKSKKSRSQLRPDQIIEESI